MKASQTLAPDNRWHAKISRRFYELLTTHPFFQDNESLIEPCWRLCVKIYNKEIYLQASTGEDKDFVELHSDTIRELFRAANGKARAYTQARQALLDLQVLRVNHSYLPQGVMGIEASCKSYKLCEQVKEYVREDTQDYLMMVHYDKQVKRDTARNRAKRAKRRKDTGDIVIDTNAAMLNQLHYEPKDYEKVLESVTNETTDAEEGRAKVQNLNVQLRRLLAGDYDVQRYQKDGRMHNPYNQLSKKMRAKMFLLVNGRRFENLYNIDYRGMHPTFFGLYLKNQYETDDWINRKVEEVLKYNNPTILNLTTYFNTTTSYLNNTIISTFNTTTPIVGTNGTITKEIGDTQAPISSIKSLLDDEVKQWNALWTAKQDPRRAVAVDLGYDVNSDEAWEAIKEKIKHSLLVDINERKSYSTPFKDWMADKFPVLFTIWRNTDVGNTGCNLSRFYESELLRAPEFYEFLKTIQGVAPLCCHDGISMFATADDKHAYAKAERVRDFLVELTFRKFGMRSIIKLN